LDAHSHLEDNLTVSKAIANAFKGGLHVQAIWGGTRVCRFYNPLIALRRGSLSGERSSFGKAGRPT
jgi:hypothetical protein